MKDYLAPEPEHHFTKCVVARASQRSLCCLCRLARSDHMPAFVWRSQCAVNQGGSDNRGPLSFCALGAPWASGSLGPSVDSIRYL
jgi:hypothetical protein